MKNVLRNALLVAASFAATPALATDFSAVTSFTGMNGNGNFYYGSTDGSIAASTLFDTTGGCVFGPGSTCMHSATANLPQASTGGSYPTVSIPGDAIVLHPGNSSSLSVFSAFVAPVAQTYQYTIDLQSVGIDTTNGIGYTFFVDDKGALTFGNRATLTTYGAATTITGTGAFAQGDVFGVIIDDNGVYYGDSTALKFNVSAVPEPATWAMMLLGFGMVGFGLRRRSKQAVRVSFG